MLHKIDYENQSSERPLLVVHGLYGSARNWGVVCKKLASERAVVAVDNRNHGESFWASSHSYFDLAGDLAGVIETHYGKVDLLGHSMGGKAAMTLALTRPELVNRLIVADIAPVSYTHSQIQYVHAMQSVDLCQVTTRSDAHAQLDAAGVSDPALRAFFLQSLDVKARKWRLNLETLAKEMPKIMSFPEIEGHYLGKTLFLSGANSDYVRTEHRPEIKALFPEASFIKISNAGHWLHAEQPEAFISTVQNWLAR